MAVIVFDKAGMAHAMHIDVWIANDNFIAQSPAWLNNGVLKAESLEELAASIAIAAKELNAGEVLARLKENFLG